MQFAWRWQNICIRIQEVAGLGVCTYKDQQPWWDHAYAVMETFWEENCDEVPDADNPAEKHDFTGISNHRYYSLPDDPDVTKRVCVGTCGFVIVNLSNVNGVT